MDETRRMAAHIKGLGFEPGSRIAILSKNCAHWLMADFAIWVAGAAGLLLALVWTASFVPDWLLQRCRCSSASMRRTSTSASSAS